MLDDTVLGWAFGVCVLAIGLITARIAGRVMKIDPPAGRNQAIDGLRGYLAFGVFLHHAAVWYFYSRTHAWGLPPPSIYRELANTCVSLFFMITAYLFIGKLLDSRQSSVDWLRLYVSRVLRLSPLYLASMLVLFSLVGVLSDWSLQVPFWSLALQIGNWIGFSMLAAPDVNGLPGTSLLIASVTWSLAYEWLFYLLLPAIAILLRVKVPWWLVLTLGLCVILLVMNKPDAIFPTSFLKGAVAAFVSRQVRLAAWLRQRWVGLFVLLAAWMALFAAAPGIVLTFVVAIGFCVVACGNTVFGLLSTRAAIVLGDVSYGVYLLHGLLLSITFEFVLGREKSAMLTPFMHWGVVSLVGIAVVITSAASYKFLEAPAMQWVKPLTSRIRDAMAVITGRRRVMS